MWPPDWEMPSRKRRLHAASAAARNIRLQMGGTEVPVMQPRSVVCASHSVATYNRHRNLSNFGSITEL